MKNFNKLITLGCSLTYEYNEPSWSTHLSNLLNIPVTNLSVSAGSNQLQIQRIKKTILNNRIDDKTLVVWQITSCNRVYARVKNNERNISLLKEEGKTTGHETFVYSDKNIFDGKARIDLVCNSPYAFEICNAGLNFDGVDSINLMEEILFFLQIIKKITPYVVVFFGWEKVMAEDYSVKLLEAFKIKLDEYGIFYADEPFVEWCRENSQNFHPDNQHPTFESGRNYAELVILPIIKKFC